MSKTHHQKPQDVFTNVHDLMLLPHPHSRSPSYIVRPPSPLPGAVSGASTHRVGAVQVGEQLDLEVVVSARQERSVAQQHGRASGQRLVTDHVRGPEGDGPRRPVAVPVPGQSLCHQSTAG